VRDVRGTGNKTQGVGNGGTHSVKAYARCWRFVQGVARRVYHRRFGPVFHAQLIQVVRHLNHDLLEPRFTECPFGRDVGGCDLWENPHPPHAGTAQEAVWWRDHGQNGNLNMSLPRSALS
jgi:hypothetical protein